jgi:dolichol-phosphate mannosyltransferase
LKLAEAADAKLVIAIVIPCYRETEHVLGVLEKVTKDVTKIYCVDDGCPDQTGAFIEKNCTDERVTVVRTGKNLGVGGAIIAGYRMAMAEGADVIVKIDGDGQMDPAILPDFVAPIAAGKADYVKGNRFYNLEFLEGMPKARLLGNAVLSFMMKLSTGYWTVFDPTNGYTAIHAGALKHLPFDKLDKRYFFESDMLFRLSIIRAVVLDVPQRAIYGAETSHLNVWSAIPIFTYKHTKNFFKRVFYCYFLRDFHVASLEWLLGPPLLLFGTTFGISKWIEHEQSATPASTGTVMLASLTFLVGLMLLLSALQFDIHNQPRTPLQSGSKKIQ